MPPREEREQSGRDHEPEVEDFGGQEEVLLAISGAASAVAAATSACTASCTVTIAN